MTGGMFLNGAQVWDQGQGQEAQGRLSFDHGMRTKGISRSFPHVCPAAIPLFPFVPLCSLFASLTDFDGRHVITDDRAPQIGPSALRYGSRHGKPWGKPWGEPRQGAFQHGAGEPLGPQSGLGLGLGSNIEQASPLVSHSPPHLCPRCHGPL